MFRGKNKDNRTASNSNVSLVDFKQVNVCWDIIESLLNDFFNALKPGLQIMLFFVNERQWVKCRLYYEMPRKQSRTLKII